MKFKTQKEIKEEKNENESDLIHEYLNFFDYVQHQLNVLKFNKQTLLNLNERSSVTILLKRIFNWNPVGDYTLITKGSNKDFIKIVYDLFTEWIDKYNNIIIQLSPYDARVISDMTRPDPYSFAEVKQAYQDFQENPEEAENKWFKCE